MTNQIIIYNTFSHYDFLDLSTLEGHIQFCSNQNDLKLHYSKLKDSLSTVIYCSTLSESDLSFIKELKKLAFFPEFILITPPLPIQLLKQVVKTGIFSIHDPSIHPALIELDIQEIKSIQKNRTETLRFRLKHTQDIELCLLYKQLLEKTAQEDSTISINSISSDQLIQSGNILSQSASKVLVVEDDQALNKRLSFWLQKEQYHCLSAHSVKEAQSYLNNEENIHIVLLDISLHNETGDTLIPLIRDLHPHAIIIMLTAYKDAELLVSCFNKGAHDYITKPFILTELSKSIKLNTTLSTLRTAKPRRFNALLSHINSQHQAETATAH